MGKIYQKTGHNLLSNSSDKSSILPFFSVVVSQLLKRRATYLGPNCSDFRSVPIVAVFVPFQLVLPSINVHR